MPRTPLQSPKSPSLTIEINLNYQSYSYRVAKIVKECLLGILLSPMDYPGGWFVRVGCLLFNFKELLIASRRSLDYMFAFLLSFMRSIYDLKFESTI